MANENTRRSACNAGLRSIIYPKSDGSISGSESDGSDFRHCAGLYRSKFAGVISNIVCAFTGVINCTPTNILKRPISSSQTSQVTCSAHHIKLSFPTSSLTAQVNCSKVGVLKRNIGSVNTGVVNFGCGGVLGKRINSTQTAVVNSTYGGVLKRNANCSFSGQVNEQNGLVLKRNFSAGQSSQVIFSSIYDVFSGNDLSIDFLAQITQSSSFILRTNFLSPNQSQVVNSNGMVLRRRISAGQDGEAIFGSDLKIYNYFSAPFTAQINQTANLYAKRYISIPHTSQIIFSPTYDLTSNNDVEVEFLSQILFNSTFGNRKRFNSAMNSQGLFLPTFISVSTEDVIIVDLSAASIGLLQEFILSRNSSYSDFNLYVNNR